MQALKHAGCSYQVISVKCELYDGEWVYADTLSAAPAFLGNPWTSKPSIRYLNILQEGECSMLMPCAGLVALSVHLNVKQMFCFMADFHEGTLSVSSQFYHTSTIVAATTVNLLGGSHCA